MSQIHDCFKTDLVILTFLPPGVDYSIVKPHMGMAKSVSRCEEILEISTVGMFGKVNFRYRYTGMIIPILSLYRLLAL